VVPAVEKQGEDVRTEGKTSDIGGGTGARSVYRKEKMGAPKGRGREDKGTTSVYWWWYSDKKCI